MYILKTSYFKIGDHIIISFHEFLTILHIINYLATGIAAKRLEIALLFFFWQFKQVFNNLKVGVYSIRIE